MGIPGLTLQMWSEPCDSVPPWIRTCKSRNRTPAKPSTRKVRRYHERALGKPSLNMQVGRLGVREHYRTTTELPAKSAFDQVRQAGGSPPFARCSVDIARPSRADNFKRIDSEKE